MVDLFAKPKLNSEQKQRIKSLYRRDNYHGLISIAVNVAWIGAAVALSLLTDYRFYAFSILIIGARQRAVASLLHEAAHGTLFKCKVLNMTIGRVLCGWTILQSFDAYRTSHVLDHHPKIGQIEHDPDFQYMTHSGVYKTQTRLRFVLRFMLSPFFGLLTPRYVLFLIRDRLWYSLMRKGERFEACMVIAFHIAVLLICLHTGVAFELLVLWWTPFLVVYPIIGWFSELAEHYPMMEPREGGMFYSRNRYAGWWERLLIGMHGDNFHLTHHLLPGIPHWHLGNATKILREDPIFRAWDDTWGGIFSSDGPTRISLAGYVLNEREFKRPVLPFRLTVPRSIER